MSNFSPVPLGPKLYFGLLCSSGICTYASAQLATFGMPYLKSQWIICLGGVVLGTLDVEFTTWKGGMEAGISVGGSEEESLDCWIIAVGLFPWGRLSASEKVGAISTAKIAREYMVWATTL